MEKRDVVSTYILHSFKDLGIDMFLGDLETRYVDNTKGLDQCKVGIHPGRRALRHEFPSHEITIHSTKC